MESENKVQNNKEYDNINNEKRNSVSSENLQENNVAKKEVNKLDSHSRVPAEE
jgi:hypothetical protein